MEGLARLIDHAPLFPPASLDMGAAVAEDARARASEQSWMLARFVCPASRLRELEAAIAPEGAPALSVVLDGGDWRDTPFRVEAVEMVGVSREDLADVETFCEVPLDEGWRDTLAAVAAAGAKAKLRCGGARVPDRGGGGGVRRRGARRRRGLEGDGRAAPSGALRARARLPQPPHGRRARGGGRRRGGAAGGARRARPGGAARRGRAAARALPLDRLVLVRRAGRGPAGAGDAVTLPLGVFSPPGGAPRVGAREGERVLDLAAVGPAVLPPRRSTR